MARPPLSNPLSIIFSRQIDDHVDYCKRLVDERLDKSDNLFRKDLSAHYGCVNAIEFLKDGDLIVSGGDDRRVLLWKVEQALHGLGEPMAMKAQHGSNIFCLGYDKSNSKIFSAGNDDQVIVHDITTGDPLEYFLHEKPVYGLSIHPENDNVFSSACDDGRVLIYDIRQPPSTDPFRLAQYKTPFHSVQFNPVEPRKLATANAEEGVSMWDVRNPLIPLLRYGFDGPTQSCMNVRFNSTGKHLLALKRRLPPVLYDVESPKLFCHFDQPGYYNSCTMKSCCFAGRNESYILSGSDDFNLYIWKIPHDLNVTWVESAHMILRGHRSIVNHVRYNERHCIIASSGVEKIIKIWSPFSFGDNFTGELKQNGGKREEQRRVFTHEEYLRLVIRSTQIMTHDYSHHSTKEDPRMMAFFDSLVQREIEGWSNENCPITQSSPNLSDEDQTNEEDDTTDSDDSTLSATQLMRKVMSKKLCKRDKMNGGLAPERPYDSPNRITRLINNCRSKLMKLAALENSSVKIDESDGSSDETSRKSKAKGIKRKNVFGFRSRRRKCKILKISDDSDEDKSVGDEFPILDAEQASTSTGLGSARSTLPRTINVDSDPGASFTSDDDDYNVPAKMQRTDDSVKQKNPGRCKNSKKYANGVNGLDNDKTPVKNVKKTMETPDSGVHSGMSTSERVNCNGENSDNERTLLRSLETFRKRVDSAKRGYRKRSTQQAFSASDSSD